MTIDQVNKIKNYISDVSFKLISDEEVRRLSLVQVTNHRSFDENSMPVDNGVYDLRLGPSKRDARCATCNLSSNECDGHYGHIKLPLPVFNPFLFKYALQFLELTCTSCFRLLIKPIERLVFEINLKLIDHQLDYLVNVVKEISADLIADSLSSQEELIRRLTGKLEEAKIFKRIDEQAEYLRDQPVHNNRNLIEMKNNLVKQFLQKRPIAFLKVCLNCKAKRPRYSVMNVAVFSTVKETTEPSLDEMFLNKITENVDGGKKHVNPLLARLMFRNLWKYEKEFLSKILMFYDFDFLSLHNEIGDQSTDEPDYLLNNVLGQNEELYGAKCPLDVFFNEYVLVSPTRFRPLRHMDDRQFESPKSSRLNAILMLANQLSKLYNLLVNTESLSEDINIDLSRRKKQFKRDQAKSIKRDVAVRSFYKIWNDLQEEVCFLFDVDMFKNKDKKSAVGLKQLIEKKEGLFRKYVMGKRVNYAARSVISPDPYIMVDEIGFPEIFAKRLSFPEPVNDHNYEELKQLVENGPNIYPGAISVQYESGHTTLLNPNDSNQRQSLAYSVTCNAYSKTNPDMKIKVVNRHLRNGDVLLVNRQPTLHKPSIMAHRAKVLPGEKTIRLHYANCKSYNADFDGDEMNAHFPQSFLTRAEGYNIVSVNYQYLVPKDGTPLSGLIQDHIVAATMLSYRGEFFTKSDYQNLVFGAISFTNKPIKFLKPSIIKPVNLWSGKQVISTIILNLIPEDKHPPTIKIASKIKPSILISIKPHEYTAGGKIKPDELCESQVIIRNGELLVGLFDKSNIGNTSYGLIHTSYELYGGEISTALLTAFARLANNYLQSKCGFTLGIYDILITKSSDRVRKKLIKKSTKVGDEAVAKAFNVVDVNNKQALLNELQDAHTSSNPVYLKMLDSSFKSKNDETSNSISKECLPAGLLKPFPYNHLQMMIQSGAKGGVVNALQISCLLGQIELEGKRVPMMISGKTLPSFKPYETSPKAGGFVTGRFLTGICPQEFFFHCMAGREGLIDTAVKTSRSGYLQRCLIKHLEGLVVNYDNTVRDSDQSVIQFLYGEDGLDILKSQLLKPKGFPLIAQNIDCLEPKKEQLKIVKSHSEIDEIKEYTEYLHEWKQLNSISTVKEMIEKRSNRGSGYTTFYEQEMCKMREELGDEFKENEIAIHCKTIRDKWFSIPKEDRNEFRNLNACTPDPICFKFNPARNYGVLSEQMDNLIYNYINNDKEKLVSKSRFKHNDNQDDSVGRKQSVISKSKFTKTINTHYLRSHCQPGEAVGLLSAQSIGMYRSKLLFFFDNLFLSEPSTQMTLNTFHFAGRGEMNVTLGIPRLREILMTASPNISTPSMDIPFRQDLNVDNLEKKAEKLKIELTCCSLSDILEYVDVTNRYVINDRKCACTYDIKFKFLKQKYFKKKYCVTPAKILEYFESTFVKNFLRSMKRKLDSQNMFKILVDVTSQKRDKNKDDEETVEDSVKLTNKINEDDESSSEEEGDGDADDARQKGTHDQELTYEEPEDEELIKSESEDELDEEATSMQKKENKENESDNEQPEEQEEQQDDEIGEPKLKKIRKRVDSNVKLDRIGAVKSISPVIDDYDFDDVREEWCTLSLNFRLNDFKIDLATLIQDEASKAVLHKIGKIDKAFLVKNSNAKEGEYENMIKTEGVSFLSLIQFSNLLNLNRVYSNDIHAIANTFGIEAGRQAIVQEMKNVFGVYGIEIDPRHLSLIADYMTFSGVIKGMNRFAINANSSPIQQITFETSTQFLKNATFIGVKDELNSPSARLFIGRPISAGSGILDCMLDKKQIQNCIKQVDESVLVTPKKSRKRKFLNIKSSQKKVKLDL